MSAFPWAAMLEAARAVGPPDDYDLREDIAQETVVRCLQYAENTGKPLHLARVVARNVRRDWGKHEQMRRRRLKAWKYALPTACDPSEWPDERLAQIARAAATLRPAYREVFALHVQQDLTYPEIAERLAIPEVNVRMRMARIRLQLRHLLKVA